MNTIAKRYLWIGGAFCLAMIALIVGILSPKHASGTGTGAPPDVMVAPVEQKDVIMRYRGGTTTYLEVLDGQRSVFDAELTLAQARGTEYQNLVQLYRALGGGWQQ